ncbi:Cytochrome P450 4V2 [Araneus ventricosus]|uniref:Cytochrome P450 4V2 n=1 Tax=Araneus ventricosus TaxID=182803 RepID=A0A4Y2K4V5_ARAVE|nr:Cytochrome P450 4V2 [Araneus ventricosus]
MTSATRDPNPGFATGHTYVVLSSSTLIDKGKEYNLLAPWLGTGLLTSTGPKWRFRRKLLTPTFHFTILEDFIPVFHEQSRVLVSKLERLDREPWVDVVPLMTSCTLDIICQTAMGVCINAQGDDNDDYVKAVHEIGNAFMYRVLRPWLYPDIIFNCTAYGRRFRNHLQKLQGFTRKVIKDKKADMIASGKLSPVTDKAPEGSPMQRKRRKAFLELLLEHHLKDPTFTEEDIREEVDTFMFEGHDTTAMALSWTLYLLGTHPEIQKVVHDEVDDIFQNDVEREVTREDLSNLKYLECVIKETLRLYPSVPIIGRECKESFQVEGHTVHRGSICIILPRELHQDPDSFPEPEKFDPERFFAENSAGRHPYAYIPFSAGPRNCIGQKFAVMEEKTVLANILRRFRVVSLDPRDRVVVQPNLTTKNVAPLRLRFEKR